METETVKYEVVCISKEEYTHLVAVKARVEAMVSYVLGHNYPSIEDCLLILGVVKEDDNSEEAKEEN